MHHDRSRKNGTAPARAMRRGPPCGSGRAVRPGAGRPVPGRQDTPQRARTTGETKPKDVTDTVLGQVELAQEKVNLADRRLRLRKLVVQPGGVVPWHSHEDRPALIYVVSGTINEYASNCAVPIEHQAGEVSVEKMGVQHWWRNTSKSPVVLLSADLFHDDQHADDHMM